MTENGNEETHITQKRKEMEGSSKRKKPNIVKFILHRSINLYYTDPHTHTCVCGTNPDAKLQKIVVKLSMYFRCHGSTSTGLSKIDKI